MSGALLNKLLPRIERGNVADLGLEQPLVEVDERLILHLAVAPVTGAVGRLVLLRQLDLVLGAVHADRDAALQAIVVLLA